MMQLEVPTIRLVKPKLLKGTFAFSLGHSRIYFLLALKR